MLRGLVAAFAIALLPAQASAVINKAVENACQSEYLTYCFGMAIPSEELRSCFRGHMMQLSQGWASVGNSCVRVRCDDGVEGGRVHLRS
jgi:hypothetical protein